MNRNSDITGKMIKERRLASLDPYKRIWSLATGATVITVAFSLMIALAKTDSGSPLDVALRIPAILPKASDCLAVIGVVAAVIIGLAVSSILPPDVSARSDHARKVEQLGASALNISAVIALAAGISAFVKSVFFTPDAEDGLLGVFTLFAGISVAHLTEIGNAGQLGRTQFRNLISKEEIEDSQERWDAAWRYTNRSTKSFVKNNRKKNMCLFAMRAIFVFILMFSSIIAFDPGSSVLGGLILSAGASLVLSSFSAFLAFVSVQSEIDRRKTRGLLERYLTGPSRGFGLLAYSLFGFSLMLVIIILIVFWDGLVPLDNGATATNHRESGYLIIVSIACLLSWTVDFYRMYWLRRVNFQIPTPGNNLLVDFWGPLGLNLLRQAEKQRKDDLEKLATLRRDVEALDQGLGSNKSSVP